MAESSYPPMAAPAVAVISPEFCFPDPIDVTIAKKLFSKEDGVGGYSVTDVSDNILLTIQSKFFGFNHRHVLLDAAGNPLVTLYEKKLSFPRRFQVFRGESRDPNELLFSAMRSGGFQMIHLKNDLDVFLPANKREDFADFKVKTSLLDRSCGIYVADTPTILAEMKKKLSGQSVVLGKDKFEVTVYPNVDYAFVAVLVVILHEMHKQGMAFDRHGLELGGAIRILKPSNMIRRLL